MKNILSCIQKLSTYSILFSTFVFFVLPSSSNYKMKSFEFGSGGMSDSGSYTMEGAVEDGNLQTGSSNYDLNAGLIYMQQANTTLAPTLQNSASWYNKLLLTLDAANNPSDTTYALAISTDNFVTTRYVQSDNTIGNSLGAEDFQTYANWGGSSGEYIIGLTPNTAYKVKVKARQGRYTESPWSAVATASTSDVTLSFDIDISAAGAESPAPYAVSMGELTLGSVTTASNKVWIDLDTNADYGAYVYVYDAYGGLKSSNINYTIGSTNADLSAITEGYGLQVNSVTQSSGGPLTSLSPYNGSSENVGNISTTIGEIFSTSSTAITGGRGAIYVKAKTSTTTPAAADYTDTLTFVASATF